MGWKSVQIFEENFKKSILTQQINMKVSLDRLSIFDPYLGNDWANPFLNLLSCM